MGKGLYIVLDRHTPSGTWALVSVCTGNAQADTHIDTIHTIETPNPKKLRFAERKD